MKHSNEHALFRKMIEKRNTRKGQTLDDVNLMRDTLLKDFMKQTEETALLAVNANSYLFKYVRHHIETSEMGLIAVKDNPKLFRYVTVSKQTPEIAAIAIAFDDKNKELVRNDILDISIEMAKNMNIEFNSKNQFYLESL